MMPARGEPRFSRSPAFLLCREAPLSTINAKAGTMHCMELGDALNLLPQMRRGALPYCVLALLRHEQRYGVEIIRMLGEVDGMVTSEGTIYPLLSRLRRQGLVETTWQESTSGPPRRYYRLTSDGHRALETFAVEWKRFSDGVKYFMEKEK
jgi:PadR family transcriptional regulator PadR